MSEPSPELVQTCIDASLFNSSRASRGSFSVSATPRARPLRT